MDRDIESTVTSLDGFSEMSRENSAVLVYLSTPDCNVCKVLKPKVKSMLADDFPEIKFVYVDCEAHPDISAQCGVFTVPTLLVYFNGRETIRKSRHIGIEELRSAIQRPYQMLFED